MMKKIKKNFRKILNFIYFPFAIIISAIDGGEIIRRNDQMILSIFPGRHQVDIARTII